jgi:hypothetical protein
MQSLHKTKFEYLTRSEPYIPSFLVMVVNVVFIMKIHHHCSNYRNLKSSFALSSKQIMLVIVMNVL